LADGGPVLFGFWMTAFFLAGGLVSVVFGSLALMPIYLLTRRLLGQKAALICGLFFACHPVLSRYVADVLSEGAYSFFFLWGIYFAWRALETKNLRYFPLTGVFAILAYLIRPRMSWLKDPTHRGRFASPMRLRVERGPGQPDRTEKGQP